MKTSFPNVISNLMPFDFQHYFNRRRELLESHFRSKGNKHGKTSCDSILDFIDPVLEILDQAMCCSYFATLQILSENNHKKIVISLNTSRQPLHRLNSIDREYKGRRRMIVGKIQTNKPT